MAERVLFTGEKNSGYLQTENSLRKLEADDLGLAQPSLTMAPTGSVAVTFDRVGATVANQAAALTSGTLRLVGCYIAEGTICTNISFVTGSTAAVAPTNRWYGIFNFSRVALRFTADALTAAIATGDTNPLALSSSFTTTYSGWHYLGIMVAAGTVPGLAVSSSSITGVSNQPPILTGGTTDTGLTTVPALPFTAGAITVQGGVPYAFVT